MPTSSQSETALLLLRDLLAILIKNNDTNWRRGVSAALSELEHVDGTINVTGFEYARSIYNTMTKGGAGLSEFYIWNNDENIRIFENKVLDDLRAALWAIFNP